MEWTLKLEHRDSEGTLHSSTLATIDRPELVDDAGFGLLHDTGKHLLWLLQMEISTAQVRSFIAKARQCSGCGRTRTIKDRRRRQIDTIFGQVRMPAPRFEPCRCGQDGDLSPVASLFPHRSTPELRHLQVSLGGEFSYRQAAKLLRQFLPDSDSFNHATIPNRGQNKSCAESYAKSERSVNRVCLCLAISGARRLIPVENRGSRIAAISTSSLLGNIQRQLVLCAEFEQWPGAVSRVMV